MEVMSKSKLKICKIIVKHSPWLIAIGHFIMAILSCFGKVWYLLSLLCSLSIIPIISMITFSVLLKFCIWHRLPLYYSIVVDILNAIYFYFNILIGTELKILIYLVIVITFILIGMYLKEKYNRNKEIN